MSIVPIETFAAYVRDELGQINVAHLTAALAAAENFVETHCARNFNVASGTATARVFGPTQIVDYGTVVRVPDFMSTTGLVVTNNGTTVAATDYQLEPLNGYDLTNSPMPYTAIRILNSVWTLDQMRATISVTADWGWTTGTVPAVVIEACKMLGKDFVTHRDSRFGFAETSVGAVSGARNWFVLNSLARYRRVESFALA
jgi:hypothetical protein